jgi:hypothetical protein
MASIRNVSLPHPNQFCQLGLCKLPRLNGGKDMQADAFMQVGNQHWGGFSSSELNQPRIADREIRQKKNIAYRNTSSAESSVLTSVRQFRLF